ncbi:uncharacterized protein VTP21DRAFT_6978 [Calcarisporiella thermophila]|uniref:uncharacterized protein n=1 Tax=Calcarisporiella thermophila TaxID=911321 RepID=UPI003744AB38
MDACTKENKNKCKFSLPAQYGLNIVVNPRGASRRHGLVQPHEVTKSTIGHHRSSGLELFLEVKAIGIQIHRAIPPPRFSREIGWIQVATDGGYSSIWSARSNPATRRLITWYIGLCYWRCQRGPDILSAEMPHPDQATRTHDTATEGVNGGSIFYGKNDQDTESHTSRYTVTWF